MGMLRCFIAISLSDGIHLQLDNIITALRPQIPAGALRWTPVHNIHLTLKFLGDVSSTQLDLLKDGIKSVADRLSPFEMVLNGLGAFPNKQKPRVLWVGVEAPKELFTLQRGIENEMSRLGYPLEEKRFSPHLTLARVSRNSSSSESLDIARALERNSVDPIQTGSIQAVDLYKSDLQPDGAVYSKLAGFKLGNTQKS